MNASVHGLPVSAGHFAYLNGPQQRSRARGGIEQHDMTIVIGGNHIVSVGPSATVQLPAGAIVHDAGPYLLAAYKAARPHVQRYDWEYGTTNRAKYYASVAEHREIIDAIVESHHRDRGGPAPRRLAGLNRDTSGGTESTGAGLPRR